MHQSKPGEKPSAPIGIYHRGLLDPERKLYSSGEGVVDWPAILRIFADDAPPFATWIALFPASFHSIARGDR